MSIESSERPVGDRVNDRVATYRARTERAGLKRVETTVPMDDASLIRDIARVLRDDGERADELRAALLALLPARRARTGAELLAFFRRCPLASAEAEEEAASFERDPSPGRTIDLG